MIKIIKLYDNRQMLCIMDENGKRYCIPYASVMFTLGGTTTYPNAIELHTTFGIIFHNDDALTIVDENDELLGAELKDIENALADILR